MLLYVYMYTLSPSLPPSLPPSLSPSPLHTPASPTKPQPQRQKAKVLYKWKGSKDNHLSIKKGEVISIIEQTEKWWSAESGGKVGWVPKTFVKLLEEDAGESQTDSSR